MMISRRALARGAFGTVVATAVGAATGRPAEAAAARPSTYIVSTESGVMPEGIAVTADGTMYVTSLGTGAVYRGNVKKPRLEPFLPAGTDGRTQAAGVHLDQYDRILIAGYATGTLFVYDRRGRLLAKRAAPSANAALNDLAITRDAVYVTDSQTGVVWRAALCASGVGELTAWLPAAAFPVPAYFLNGIAATRDGRYLLVVDQGTELLFRVDVRTRVVTQVAVTRADGSPVTVAGDGLLLEGSHLYAAVNYANAAGGYDFAVWRVDLSPDLSRGRIAAVSEVESSEQAPTTIAREGKRLLWVNSQLASASPTPPFTVTEVVGLR